MSTLERAIAIAAEAHAGQCDKGGQPYILHPLRVTLGMKTDTTRIVAVLHDVVEDTDWTFDDLKNEGFADEVVDAVDALTRRAGEDYMEFVRRAKANALAKPVKIADVRDNMDVTRLRNFGERDRSRLARYEKALAILLSD